MPAKPTISVVIPVHNEQDDVAELTHRLTEVLGPDDEIIFVDDGSSDATWQRLEKLHQPDRVRLIKFRTNFGKAAALMAGFALTRGELVFTMDGDLQDDPSEIPRFIERLDEGFDLVSGWKKTRHDPINKVIASRIFNSCVRRLTRVNLHDMNCGFKCYRGDLARSVRIYGELHRFIPALAAHGGYRVGEIEVRHQARKHGRSRSTAFSRLFKGFFRPDHDPAQDALCGPAVARVRVCRDRLRFDSSGVASGSVSGVPQRRGGWWVGAILRPQRRDSASGRLGRRDSGS